MIGFSAKDAAEACHGEVFGPNVSIIRKWRSDSREVREGDAFVAIRGASTDGHLYIPQTIKSGARVVLAAKDEADKLAHSDNAGVTFIAADDTVKAAALIAEEYLRRLSPHVTAITGSVGKTTVRELTLAALKTKKKTHAAVRSFNTIIGCSLTVLSMPADTEELLLELGTNHFGEISELVAHFKPQTAVITEVAPAHLEGFGSVEGVLRAKMEICGSPNLQTIIYNADNPLINEYMSYNYNNVKKIAVGHAASCDVRVLEASVALTEEGPRTAALYDIDGKQVQLESPLFGLQHAMNMGYALAAASIAGVSADDVKKATAAMDQLSGRGLCRRTKDGGWVIDEAYNANPASMHAAVCNTREAAESIGAKKRAVIGGMRELGPTSPEWHAKAAKELKDFDCVKLIGAEWRAPEVKLGPNMELYGSLEEMTASFGEDFTKGSVVLVKGSNSYGLKRAAAALSGENDAV